MLNYFSIISLFKFMPSWEPLEESISIIFLRKKTSLWLVVNWKKFNQFNSKEKEKCIFCSFQPEGKANVQECWERSLVAKAIYSCSFVFVLSFYQDLILFCFYANQSLFKRQHLA